jgi:hypothetical protein
VVAHLVEQRGVGARAEKIDALSLSRFLSWETEGVELICLCYVAYATPAQIHAASQGADPCRIAWKYRTV